MTTHIEQTNITRPLGTDTNYFVCGYCGTGCWHGTYCGCAASRREVGGEDTPALSVDDIVLDIEV